MEIKKNKIICPDIFIQGYLKYHKNLKSTGGNESEMTGMCRSSENRRKT